MSWFRYHVDALDNPKIQTLPAVLFRFWVNLLCVSQKVSGFLPESAEISFRCRVPESQVLDWLEELKKRRLVDVTDDGRLFMHDWNDHQFVSDDVTARVRKHRMKRQGNVSVTPPEENRTDYRPQQIEETCVLSQFSEFPETASAIREGFPETSDVFVMQLSIAVGQKVAGLNGKIKGEVTDALIAEAVRHCRQASPKQNSAGLYLRTVPQCVATWVTAGKPITSQPKKVNFNEIFPTDIAK